MRIVYTKTFSKDFKKVKDNKTREKILKIIIKLAKNPEIGKPLRYKLKGYRSVRIKPYRIIYRIEEDKIIINCFDHREEVYK
ncbi:MAG TPA: type II toxin-antitoxin system RelE/ParE family toxin [Candidatus Nanoarchaeia archaeon]|nr:type II toxin-antitoxin system RelE/ParE family toxin [Candidatus Nanoarchaeia archaeon]